MTYTKPSSVKRKMSSSTKFTFAGLLIASGLGCLFTYFNIWSAPTITVYVMVFVFSFLLAPADYQEDLTNQNKDTRRASKELAAHLSFTYGIDFSDAESYLLLTGKTVPVKLENSYMLCKMVYEKNGFNGRLFDSIKKSEVSTAILPENEASEF